MKMILALLKIPKSAEETKKLFFGKRNFMSHVECQCGSDPRELDSIENPEFKEEILSLDIQETNNGEWPGIINIDFISEDMFKYLFENKQSLTRDEIVDLVRHYNFKDCPFYSNFIEDESWMKWESYFVAEKKAAQKVVDLFIEENKRKSFVIFDSFNIDFYGDSLLEDGVFDRFPYFKIDDSKFH